MDKLKVLKNLLFPETNDEIKELFDMGNMMSLKIMCIVTALIEGVSLVFSFVLRDDSLHYDLTTFVVTIVICTCILTAFLANLFLKKKIQGHTKAVLISFACVSILTIFALFVSYMNYIVGRQIIIFYALNLCLVCFVHIAPLFQVSFILIEHLIFYGALLHYDGAKEIIWPNTLIYLCITLAASVISYDREYQFIVKTCEAKVLAANFQIKSSQDQLTGLLNRYALDSIPSVSKGTTCQIAMADIDHFKMFNDRYGHLKGDEVLKITASALLDVFRKKDCYRYGGDEFLILTANLSEDVFRDRLALWENKLAGVKIEGVEDPIKISYGVASGTINTTDDIFNMIKEADTKLYAIKSLRHKSS